MKALTRKLSIFFWILALSENPIILNILFGDYKKMGFGKLPIQKISLSRRRPTKRDLIKEDVSGGFPDIIFQALQKDPQLFQEIVQELLDSNFPIFCSRRYFCKLSALI